jgi:hypothetical protein
MNPNYLCNNVFWEEPLAVQQQNNDILLANLLEELLDEVPLY